VLVAAADVGAVGGLGHRPLAGPVDHRPLIEQHPPLPGTGRVRHDQGERVELADHDGGHGGGRLADLLERALHQALVLGLGRDHPDEARLVPVIPGRMPAADDLAQVVGEPVDAGQRGEGVVDRG
jgi:hypothetical protein